MSCWESPYNRSDFRSRVSLPRYILSDKKMPEFFSNRLRHGRHLETVTKIKPAMNLGPTIIVYELHDKPALCKISVKLVQLCLRDWMIERQTASQLIFLLYVLVEIRTSRSVYPTGKWTWWPWGTTMKWREKERERGALWTLSLDDWWCRLTLYQELMRPRRLSFTTRYAK